MIIDEIIVLNLKREARRKGFMIGALDTMDVPMDRVRFWEATDRHDFNNDLKTVATAAIDDGFPQFKLYITGTDDNQIRSPGEGHAGILAQAWSYHQILRYVSTNNVNAMVLYDDRVLKFKFPFYANLFKYAAGIWDQPFKFFQLEHYDIMNFLPTPQKIHHTIPYMVRGPIGGSENAMMFSPDGARFFLDFMERNFQGNIELTLAYLSQMDAEKRDGIWSTIIPLTRATSMRFGSGLFEKVNVGPTTLSGE